MEDFIHKPLKGLGSVLEAKGHSDGYCGLVETSIVPTGPPVDCGIVVVELAEGIPPGGGGGMGMMRMLTHQQW